MQTPSISALSIMIQSLKTFTKNSLETLTRTPSLKTDSVKTLRVMALSIMTLRKKAHDSKCYLHDDIIKKGKQYEDTQHKDATINTNTI
jgi:hypothetical protein